MGSKDYLLVHLQESQAGIMLVLEKITKLIRFYEKFYLFYIHNNTFNT